eukprot:4487411-Heterocapsa_arctica.AAC.1
MGLLGILPSMRFVEQMQGEVDYRLLSIEGQHKATLLCAARSGQSPRDRQGRQRCKRLRGMAFDGGGVRAQASCSL